MKTFFKQKHALVIFATFMVLGISQSARSAAFTGTISADAGTYPPIVLGTDNINLNACGSTFEATSGDSFNICTSGMDISGFDFTWRIFELDNAMQTVTSTALPVTTGAAGGDQISLTTGGITDIIKTAGFYRVLVNVSTTVFPINMANGDTLNVDFFATPSGNSDSAFSALITVVPEPAAAFLLLPALVYIGRRQKLQGKKTLGQA